MWEFGELCTCGADARCEPLRASPSENQFLKFVSYFRGPILYVMEIAVVLSAGLQDWIDFVRGRQLQRAR